MATPKPREAAVQKPPMARPYWAEVQVETAVRTGMKLEVKSPVIETTITNCSGAVRKGKIVNPTASARMETRMISCPLPVRSRIPPHSGEKSMVSMAGMRLTREISV